jgi:RNA polymerase sigma-70 factor, ECF subfamily
VSSGTRDRDEVQRLYEVHGRALLAYACAFLRDRSEAEDVLHQVFLQLLRNGGTEISSVGYLFRAVRNRVLNHLRGRSREASLDEAALNDRAQWLEDPSGSTEIALALQSALGTLPVDQREVIILRVWGQLTFEEVASIVGVSPNTAASRYRYGLAKLSEIWHGRT